VVSVALPPANVAEPSGVAPSFRVTVPVGVPLPGAFTVTLMVNVTVWPKFDGLGEEVRVVVVDALLTFCVNVGVVLVAKLTFPEYTAVIE
jgi:hypothetical protein